MGIKLAGVMFIIMLTMSGLGYWYYKDTQDTIAELNAEKSRLEVDVALGKETISSLEQSISDINTQLIDLNDKYVKIREQRNDLVTRLAKHDIGVLGVAKPDSITRIITNASNKAARCFELLSGAELTQEEKNAETANQFNSECPWLWTGTNP